MQKLQRVLVLVSSLGAFACSESGGGGSDATPTPTPGPTPVVLVAVEDGFFAARRGVTVTTDVTLNDTTAGDATILGLIDWTPAAHGIIDYLGGGVFSYDPDPDAPAVDSFTYTVADDLGRIAVGTVTIAIDDGWGEPSPVTDVFATQLVLSHPVPLVVFTRFGGVVLAITHDGAAWSAPVVLSSGTGSISGEPTALNATIRNGRVLLTWRTETSSQFRLHRALFSSGTGMWTHVAEFQTANKPDTAELHGKDLGPNGEMVFVTSVGGTTSSQFRFLFGHQSSGTQSLASGENGLAPISDVQAIAPGVLRACWKQSGRVSCTRGADGTWSAPAFADPPGGVTLPRLVIGTNGGAWLAWTRNSVFEAAFAASASMTFGAASSIVAAEGFIAHVDTAGRPIFVTSGSPSRLVRRTPGTGWASSALTGTTAHRVQQHPSGWGWGASVGDGFIRTMTVSTAGAFSNEVVLGAESAPASFLGSVPTASLVSTREDAFGVITLRVHEISATGSIATILVGTGASPTFATDSITFVANGQGEGALAWRNKGSPDWFEMMVSQRNADGTWLPAEVAVSIPDERPVGFLERAGERVVLTELPKETYLRSLNEIERHD